MGWSNSEIENAILMEIEADHEESAKAGMELRDWFAGQALTQTCSWKYGNDWGRSGKDFPRLAAQMAYRLADAMMEERAKRSK